MDSLILTAHIQPIHGEKVIDVGCGCGIIPLILAFQYPDLKITGVEIQEGLAGFARKNVISNRLEKAIQIIHSDIKAVGPSDIGGKAQIIVSNPPYKKKNSGRLNPDGQKAIARHEITIDIDILFKCSDRLLKKQGRVYLIFPAERIASLMQAMARYKFTPDFIRFVHTHKNIPAKRIILCAVKNARRNCIVRPPLYIHTTENKYSREYTRLFKP